MTAAGVEALEEAGEGLAVAGHHLAFEGLVVGVEADHPRAVAEVPGDHRPHLVELPLQVAHHVVLPEVGDGDVERAVAVVARPPTGDGHGRLAVGAEGPGGRPLTREGLGVDVLVHVEQRVDVVAGQQVDDAGHLGQVATGDRRHVHVGVPGRPRRAHRRLIGPPVTGLETLPLDPEPHDVEAEPGDGGGVSGAEGVGLARGGGEDERRPLVDGVHPAEEHHPTEPVAQVRSAGRPQRPRDDGLPGEARRPPGGVGDSRRTAVLGVRSARRGRSGRTGGEGGADRHQGQGHGQGPTPPERSSRRPGGRVGGARAGGARHGRATPRCARGPVGASNGATVLSPWRRLTSARTPGAHRHLCGG